MINVKFIRDLVITWVFGLVLALLIINIMLPKNDSIIYHKQDSEGVANYGFELNENECLYVNGDDYTDFFITECVKED